MGYGVGCCGVGWCFMFCSVVCVFVDGKYCVVNMWMCDGCCVGVGLLG